MPSQRLAASTVAGGDAPRTSPRRRAVAVMLAVLLAGWSVLEVLRPFAVLEVRLVGDDRQATPVLAIAGDGFEVRYVHSYNHFTVREVFSREDEGDGVVVVGQLVDGEGAGIAEVAGETRWVDAGNGWSWLDGLDRSLDGPLRLRIGYVADHRLVHGCRELPLTDVGAPFTAAEIGWAPAGPARWLGAHLTGLRSDPVAGPCTVPGPLPTTSTSAGSPRR